MNKAWFRFVLVLMALFVYSLLLGGCQTFSAYQLTETFTSQDGSFSIRFPEGWTVLTVDDQISLGSRLDIIMPAPRSQVVLGIGDVEGSVFVEDAEDLGLLTGEMPVDVLQRFRRSLEREQFAPAVEQVETLSIDGRSAARVQTRYDNDDQVTVIVRLSSDLYGVVSLRTGRGGGSQISELAAAVAGSIRLVDGVETAPTRLPAAD